MPTRFRWASGLFVALTAASLFACSKERPETPTVSLLMTASNTGETGPCG